MTTWSSEGRSGEEQLISRHFVPLATHPAALGLRDDVALLDVPPGHHLLLKTDPVISGVHFFADDPPEVVARKALRVNLSDLAAKGAKPFGFLMALALPPEIGEGWLDAFAATLREDMERYGCALLGGDTDRTPGPLTVSITVLGTVPQGTMVRRSGARAGDRIVVTGTLGDATLGLWLRRDPSAAARWGLDEGMRKHLLRRYLVPEPRLDAAEALRRHAHGAMDVSDGLAGDLAKMCRASGVSATVQAERVPLSSAARRALGVDARLIDPLLTGGDDYEILAAIPGERFEPFVAEAAAHGVAVTEIGAISAGDGKVRFLGPDGAELVFARPSFSHF